MTILNDFAKAAETAADHLGKYYATRDSNEITAAIEVLQHHISVCHAETDAPQLQEAVVSLTRMTGQEMMDGFQKDNALCLRNEEYISDGPIEEGKLLRVKSGVPCGHFDGDPIYLTKVTALTANVLILAPVVAA